MTQMRRANGSTVPTKYPTFDSPTAHGWTVRRTDSDGIKIWELRENGETIAVMKPSEDEWCNVAVLPYGKDDPQWYEITGTYQEITQSTRRLYCLLLEDDQIFTESLHYNGDPEDYQPDFEQIPWDGCPMYDGDPLADDYGMV